MALVGRLASMSRRAAQQIVREQGGVVVDPPDESAQWLVVGEEGAPLTERDAGDWLDEPLRDAVDAGRLEVLSETQFWQRLGLVDDDDQVRRLYTPAMLAELLGVPVGLVRRWHRRGLLVATREVRRLPYFDFSEVSTARRLAELIAAGVSARAIERKLTALGQLLPHVRRPLAEMSVVVEGKELLLRHEGGLLDPGGQLRIDFDASEADVAQGAGDAAEALDDETSPPGDASLTPDMMLQAALRWEDDGELQLAADAYRAALAAGGPNAEICFLLAELLYRSGDLSAARERYSMAIEIDEDYVEARSNLGCVWAELGRIDLAIASFEGALAFHAEYPDAHYHLARALDEQGDHQQAQEHWQAFLKLAPENPWADVARARLEQDACDAPASQG